MKPNMLIDSNGDGIISPEEQEAADAAAAETQGDAATKAALEAEKAAQRAAINRAEALALGITETLIQAFPELKSIFDDFVAGNIAKARMDYFASDYYKNLTDTAKKRQTQQKTQRGAYDQEFGAWKEAQRRRLIGKGFPWSADIEALLENSYLRGDTDVQVEMAILNSSKMGKNIAGSTLGTVNALRNEATNQGVNNILPASYWDKVTMGILSGTLTSEGIEEEIKGFAMSAYPAYAKGIQEGRSFSLQTSAARQMLANTLEKDIDTITNDNPLFQKAVGYVNPKTGAFEIMPLWQVEKLAKSSEDWLYTKNAQATFDSLGRNVLQSWGLAF